MRRRLSFVSAVTLGMIGLADYLFFEQPIGWSVGLYAAALLGALLMRGGAVLGAGKRVKAARILVWLVLGLIGALVAQPGPMVVGLTLVGLVSLAAVQRGGWTSSVAEWLRRWLWFAVRGIVQPMTDAALAGRVGQWRAVRGGRGGVDNGAPLAFERAARWLLPGVVGVVFALLFISANPVIEWGVRVFGEEMALRLERLPEWLPAARWGLWLVAGLGVWALLRVRFTWRAQSQSKAFGQADPRLESVGFEGSGLSRVLPSGVVWRSLLVFNAMFAVHLVLDGVYLLGDTALPDGMTLAAYAQRGAYPLLATALLAGGFVLLGCRSGERGAGARLVRLFVTLWVGQNVLLLATAVWRLNLYVEAYSLTRLRVAAAVWMGVVAVAFVLVLWRVLAERDNAWLLRRAAVLGVAVVYASCFVNFDGFIARYNVAHSAELRGEAGGSRVDLMYLEHLGPEALPALERLSEELAWDHPRAAEVRHVAHRLRFELWEQTRDWRGWTLRRGVLLASR
ncbi:MAG: DUF4173 domain-containing protein [Planctomycetota bacterium]